MNLYDVNQTEDFNGTNGLELSIRKWESIVEALGERLSKEDREKIANFTTSACGICRQYGCGSCPIDPEGFSCGDELGNTYRIDSYAFNNKPKAPALKAAKAMLSKLESLQ